jgi:hypothetical protein
MTPYVARILLGVACAAVALIFAWKHCCALWRFWSAPLRNDQHRFLSLVRILLGLLVLSVCAPFWDGHHWQAAVITREYFWKYGGAGVVIVLALAMLGDIVSSKGGLAVMMALAGNKLAAIPNLGMSVPGMSAGGEVDPPPPAPDLKEQSG